MVLRYMNFGKGLKMDKYKAEVILQFKPLRKKFVKYDTLPQGQNYEGKTAF